MRKALRSRFNKSYRENDWPPYKSMLKEYNKARKTAKTEHWRKFCEDIDSTKDTARLRKILSKSPSVPSYLQSPDGTYTQSSEESNNLLMDTHFPGSVEINPQSICNQHSNYNYINHNLFPGLISEDKVRWAISSFEPFKSPGPDGIFSKMLQILINKITPILVEVYTMCIKTNTIPNKWKEVKVVFIPKAGKVNHSKAKDYRPISLSSFLMKVLERILDEYIRGLFNPSLISPSQHAYIKGKSTETALHEVVRTIESSLEHNQYTLAAFLDIEGAFNNVSTTAITSALQSIGVPASIICWIEGMLKSRVIYSSIGSSNISRSVCRGTPQGG